MSSPCPPLPQIGLIGISGYAQIHLDLLREEAAAAHCALAAVVVVPEDQGLPVVASLRTDGVRVYASFAAFLAGEAGRLDLCIIPTGIPWHARMTMGALEAGMPVFVEKPLAGSQADAEAICRAEAATGQWVAVGFQDRADPATRWFEEQLGRGVIGRVESIRMIGQWPRSGNYYARNRWAGRIEAEGAVVRDSPLNNAFAHFVTLVLSMAGAAEAAKPVEVEAAELYRAHAIESFDTAVVRARSAAGVPLWFGVTHACAERREPEIHVQGSGGTASWFHGRSCQLQPTGAEAVTRPLPNDHDVRRHYLATVLARLDDPGAPVCGTDLALAHTGLVAAIHRAGTIETLPETVLELRPVPGEKEAILTIRAIETFLDQALQRGSLLHEAGFNPHAPLPTPHS